MSPILFRRWIPRLTLPLFAVTDILERSSSWYGTLILVRKDWLRKNGLDQMDMSLIRYKSPMARTLLNVEVGNTDGIAVSSFILY